MNTSTSIQDLLKIIEEFDVNPEDVGFRPRGWWIIDSIDEEENAGAMIGDLCVRTRDGASNPMDINAFKKGNCIGSTEDLFDNTYRYYYYRKIKNV